MQTQRTGQCSRRDHIAAPALAVDRQSQRTAGAGAGSQRPPAGVRVGEMMQHADALDMVVALRGSLHCGEVRLGEAQVGQAGGATAPHCMRQAGTRQVDAQHHAAGQGTRQ